MDVLLLLMSAPRAEYYEGPGDFMMDAAGRLTFRPERRIAPYVYAGLHIAARRACSTARQKAHSA